jgi:protein-L-isoaspartate(D-aspartate) O-methyltransferase
MGMGNMPANHVTSWDWHQYDIVFPDHRTGERVTASHLLPAMTSAQADGTLSQWWYVRKRPAWKLRYLAPAGSLLLDRRLSELAEQGIIAGWTTGIYEPEIAAFGGEQAMDIAHQLFHRDSVHLLARVAQAQPLRQRETTMLLCSAMLRAAGLDWYEQGDVWDKVAALRAGAGTIEAERTATLTPVMLRLMTATIRDLPGHRHGPLASYGEWIAPFEEAGQELADLARTGSLHRGLRSVLAHHVIFHANRAGLPVAEQAILAGLAAASVFGGPSDAVSVRQAASTHS